MQPRMKHGLNTEACRHADGVRGPSSVFSALPSLTTDNERLNTSFASEFHLCFIRGSIRSDPRGKLAASIGGDVYPPQKGPKRLSRI
jgi:hypothetical protein